MAASAADASFAEVPLPETTLVERLDRIGERVGSLARLVSSLRDENRQLQATLERERLENRQLRERVDAARERVEQLIERLPDA